MDKRAILGIALSVLVLVIYQEWLKRYYGTSTPAAPVTQQTPPPAATKSPAVTTGPISTNTVTAPAVVQSETPARDVRVETDHYTAVFTTRGARLKSFQFKNYRSSVDDQSPPFDIVPAAPQGPLPLGVRWSNPAAVDDSAIGFNVEGGDLKLTGDDSGSLVFSGQTANGVTITKKLKFSGAQYPIQVEIGLKTSDGTPIASELILAARSDVTIPNPDAPFEGVIALVDNKTKREHLSDDLKKGIEFSGELSWAGFGYTYFFIGLVPDIATGSKVRVGDSNAALLMNLNTPLDTVSGTSKFTLFVGPKEISVLESLGKGLDRAIDFGWFGFISIPLLYILHFCHRFTASYGVDIIILTVMIKILTAPLTHKSYASMKAMQKLGPQMEKLKEKYANDKEKLNKEMMDMYRRNGVNPLGGCLPMVLQFPIFLGLYNALHTPIELRHSSFLWIKDLSRPDWQSLPFTLGDWHLGIPILTILMGASMFLQQWMTPSVGDPNQRKMMMMMPLLFTFMFISFPAGLTIYWLINNVLSIAQQYWINSRQ